MKTKTLPPQVLPPGPLPFTQGDWSYSKETYSAAGGREFHGIGNGCVHIGYASIAGCVRAREAEANARLMTAAPMLLSALAAFVREYQGNGHDDREKRPEMILARAAIKKAFGL